MAQSETHIFRIALRDEPSTYREIEVSSAKSLWNFAQAIIGAFDFDFVHAFGFYSGRSDRALMSARPRYELFADMGEESDARSDKKTKIAEAFPSLGHRMTLLFDYGDEWLFNV